MKKLILLLSIFFIGINHTYSLEKVTFSKCVDGDTFRVFLNEEEYYVRMLAIDTPESVKEGSSVEYYGKESSEYTCNKLKNAKKIELEYDDNSSQKDKYDRLLAWVWIDDELLQADLVENGYAEVAYLYNDYKYTEKLQKLETKASSQKIGIWNEEAKNNYTEEDTEEEENILIIISAIVIFIIMSISNLLNKRKSTK